MKINKDMEVDGQEVLYLYLTDWQMRMVKDFLDLDCDGIEIPVKNASRLLYMAPDPVKRIEHKRMYLTEWQIRELRDLAGMHCEFIELTKDVKVFHYGVPTK